MILASNDISLRVSKPVDALVGFRSQNTVLKDWDVTAIIMKITS